MCIVNVYILPWVMVFMKCPEHNIEMSRIAETVNASDGTSVFWLCEGIGRFPRKHVLMTEDWFGYNRFYGPEWKRLELMQR